ncbi:MAG TPA: DNA polymerase III subunit delta [Burkholderiales bacterium]|nr:DNA polymerase III subunit delta [Burkholderiales bacterium]
MPALRQEQLEAHLARELRPLYAIHGDEPLLSMEAADAIRARARAAGFAERSVLLAERGFDWSELAASGASLSLFGDRKLIELRLPSGKPGTDGAHAIEAFCAKLPPDTLTLVMLPRLDRAGQSSPWFAALESKGVIVNVFPVERPRLPEWIASRLARQKQSAKPETLRFLADCVEGNLLAAHQEIQKLGLLLPPGELGFDAVREAVMNVARYDAGKLGEAMLSGDRARLARMLEGLRGEGEAPPRVLWLLAEEIRAICRVQSGIEAGRPLGDVLREARVWGDARQALVGKAARNLSRGALHAALEHAAGVDRVVKGVVKGDAWDELLQLGLRFAA